MSIFKLSKESRIIIIFIICICSIGLTIAFFYYRGINKAEDPRMIETRYMLQRFNTLMQQKKYLHTFPLLDSIKQIIAGVPGYSGSYEMGVVFNNYASVYISLALYSDIDSTEKQYHLKLAEQYTNTCIHHYKKWLDSIGQLNKDQISTLIKPNFIDNDPAFKGRNSNQIMKKRVKDIILAQKETPRRLSVAYTNLGIVKRHQYLQNEAIGCYVKAIELWKDNPTALSNLSVLYGKPPKDRSVINKLFPPNKNN